MINFDADVKRMTARHQRENEGVGAVDFSLHPTGKIQWGVLPNAPTRSLSVDPRMEGTTPTPVFAGTPIRGFHVDDCVNFF